MYLSVLYVRMLCACVCVSMSPVMGKIQVGPWMPTTLSVRYGTAPCGVPVLFPDGFASTDL